MCEELNGYFYCPKCKKLSQIEEVLSDVIQSSRVTVIAEGGAIDYGEYSTSGGFVERYQCLWCGHVIKDGDNVIRDPGELYNWLKEHLAKHG